MRPPHSEMAVGVMSQTNKEKKKHQLGRPESAKWLCVALMPKAACAGLGRDLS